MSMAPTIGVNLRVTGHCNQGGRKYMEDAFVVAYQQTEDEKDLEYAYFGIFDGHGGREAALFAKEHLMDYIVDQKNFWSDDDELVLKAIRNGFITTHLAMWKEVGKWPKTLSGLPSTSGTTSSIAFIRRGKMYVGHVGDSKIVVGFQEPGSSEWLPMSLTKDHKPESPKEKKRIYSVGGLVMNKAGVERVVWNRPRLGHKGPIRRSTPFDQIPFLAVARSLGDLWSYNYLRSEFVVSPEPDVSVFTLRPKRDRCVILASDGLWNMVSPIKAVRMVQKAEEENEQIILEGGGPNGVGKPANNPSKKLVDEALELWFLNRMRADNTSVVTVLLDPPGPPKCEVLLRQKVMQKLRPRDDQNDSENQPNQPEFEVGESKLPKKPSSEFGSIKGSEDASLFLPKEKKKMQNFCETRSNSLPKPVVLSPQRMIVRRVVPRSDSKGSPINDSISNNAEKPEVLLQRNQEEFLSQKPKSCCSPVTDEKETNLTTNSSSNASNDEFLCNAADCPIVGWRTTIGNEDGGMCSNSCAQASTFTECSTSNPCDAEKTKDIENEDIINKNCPTVVDKLEKSEGSELREKDVNHEPSLSVDSKPVVGSKRKLSEDGSSNTTLTPQKNVRLNQNNSWEANRFSNCRTVAASHDTNLSHCTRAQQRTRKMKV